MLCVKLISQNIILRLKILSQLNLSLNCQPSFRSLNGSFHNLCLWNFLIQVKDLVRTCQFNCLALNVQIHFRLSLNILIIDKVRFILQCKLKLLFVFSTDAQLPFSKYFFRSFRFNISIYQTEICNLLLTISDIS